MAKRTPLQSVILIRDGKRVIPEIGKVFDFTAEEIKQIEGGNPAALSKQAVVNLTEDAKPADEAPDDTTYPNDTGEAQRDPNSTEAVAARTAPKKTATTAGRQAMSHGKDEL